jgi:hypothetical protein
MAVPQGLIYFGPRRAATGRRLLGVVRPGRKPSCQEILYEIGVWHDDLRRRGYGVPDGLVFVEYLCRVHDRLELLKARRIVSVKGLPRLAMRFAISWVQGSSR